MTTVRKADIRTAAELAQLEDAAFRQEAAYLAARLYAIALQMELYAYSVRGGDIRNIPLAGELRALRGGVERRWLGKAA